MVIMIKETKRTTKLETLYTILNLSQPLEPLLNITSNLNAYSVSELSESDSRIFKNALDQFGIISLQSPFEKRKENP